VCARAREREQAYGQEQFTGFHKNRNSLLGAAGPHAGLHVRALSPARRPLLLVPGPKPTASPWPSSSMRRAGTERTRLTSLVSRPNLVSRRGVRLSASFSTHTQHSRVGDGPGNQPAGLHFVGSDLARAGCSRIHSMRISLSPTGMQLGRGAATRCLLFLIPLTSD
jgi:hypothetical protein